MGADRRVTNNRGTTTRVTQGSGGEPRSAGAGTRGEQRSARAGVAISTRGTTATFTRKVKAADGRSTKTAVGATWRRRRRNSVTPRRMPAHRHVTKPGPADRRRRLVSSIVGQLLVNSIVTRVHVDRGSERTYDAGRARQGSSSSRGGYSGSYRPSGGQRSGGGRRR